MFCDEIQLQVQAGRGGNGGLSFHRKKYQPKGGPDGGDGGHGGNVFLIGDPELNALSRYRHLSVIAADRGEDGQAGRKRGKTADDAMITVPLGTRVREKGSEQWIGEIIHPGQKILLARGGRGGYGNAHFTTSIRQAPRFAELGEPGEQRQIELELKLVADVGVIGLPSAGKSTLLSVVSNARPKIGDYPFTTTIPNLGVVDLSDGRSFTMCDLPGLIAGASEGKGLGHQFLRHVERNRVMLHLIDVTSLDPVEDYQTIRDELGAYDQSLFERPEVIALSKVDMADEEIVADLSKNIAQAAGISPQDIYPLSSLTQSGVKPVLEAVWAAREQSLINNPILLPEPEGEEVVVYEPHLQELSRAWKLEEVTEADTKKEGIDQPIEAELIDDELISDIGIDDLVTHERRYWQIIGQRIEQIAVMTDITNREAVARLRDVLRKLAIEKELLKRGAHRGDMLIIGVRLLDFQPLLIREKQRQHKLGE